MQVEKTNININIACTFPPQGATEEPVLRWRFFFKWHLKRMTFCLMATCNVWKTLAQTVETDWMFFSFSPLRQWKEQKTEHAVLDSLDCLVIWEESPSCAASPMDQWPGIDVSVEFRHQATGETGLQCHKAPPPVRPLKRHLYTVHLYLLRREFAAKSNYCLEF